MNFINAFRKVLSAEHGSALLEFTVSVPVVLVLTIGIMDCSRALYADHYVASSARLAARYAMVRGATWKGRTCTDVGTYSCAATAADITNFVRSSAPPGISPTALSIQTTWTGTTPAGGACNTMSGANAPGCVVNVKVVYAFDFVSSILPQGTITFARSRATAITQ